ncbi:uncharacterized protein EV422DRAFT_509958 [Fimicolochytrium jonesii]|uniref:uncharacterized protein n=1 Tax=Fimicolochytrium jonesii TaxID=1396493 RepID=UPI0022FEC0EB|nr:uncharacterized protein EV422DRAFT_509958 [Fimicolochytrium jonesii]KAI8816226.1 hypothetical protein EV422DRAFT_509958 [Fimicolochytrium jonesii]
MPLAHPLKIWSLASHVASRGPLASPSRLGTTPPSLQPYKRLLPTLLHGKRIHFGDSISSKGSNRTRRAYLPNIITHALYSRSLDMLVHCRLSTHALREIDAAGGLDEYLLTVRNVYTQECEVARMYQRRVAEKWYGPERMADGFWKEIRDLGAKVYGDGYVAKVKAAEREFERVVRSRVREREGVKAADGKTWRGERVLRIAEGKTHAERLSLGH